MWGVMRNKIELMEPLATPMETFEVKRGLVKQVIADGGLNALASDYFDNVESYLIIKLFNSFSLALYPEI